ncbi:MAG: N(4)-(beta-N-acetylglucosaminyl)-L-asparaginase [Saprospiraceae bacterium]|nr:N(4)-(beta-N-acetylglucosaminyl)-L-asparaginase [Saprospiraceae bacterium]
MAANQVAMDRLKDGASAMDAVEAGVRVSEADPRITSVGKGGFPDAEGDVTLDACIMDHQARCGAVAALENTLHPISVARAVMERTPHIFLVGQKAVDFARRLGFPKEDLLTHEARAAWKEWRKGNPRWRDFSTDISNHDTIGMLAIDARGNLSGACTTSGWAFKVPGRVGDSPIIGAGLFVDNEVGAATATGTGEEVIRISGAFLIVELMRNGYSPLQACQEAVRRVRKNNPNRKDLFVGFLALNKQGEFGAWATKSGFEYAVTSLTEHRLETSGY